MSTYEPKILIATDIGSDGESIKELLSEEFVNIYVSKNPAKYVEHFEKVRPAALMLAFKSLAKAEEYYLGLYKNSLKVHAIPHRTLVLCTKDEVPEVYQSCKKRNFDDYVLFWPMAQDGLRLRMAVHHAVHYMMTAEGVTASEIANQARRISGLESLLEQAMSKIGSHIDVAQKSITSLEHDIIGQIETLIRKAQTQRPAASNSQTSTNNQATETKPVDFSQELQQLRQQGTQRIRSASSKITPIQQWEKEFKQDIEPEMEKMRALQAMANEVPPNLLVVEDEKFQHKIIAHLLDNQGINIKFCLSASEALVALRTFRPDLILMDIDLPDISGIQATAQIKSIKTLKKVPVVMMTAHSEKERVVQSLKAGASDYLVKPLDKEKFITKISKHLFGLE